MKATDFYTRTPANKGGQMPIPDPVTDKPSGCFLTVHGLDSDSFRAAVVEKSRDNLRILGLPKDEQVQAEEDATNNLFVSVVSAWTLEEKFSREALLALIVEAPYIRKAIDSFSSNRANFIIRQSGI